MFICGRRQPNFPTWESGVHTHAGGIVQIHPSVQLEIYRNGDRCHDGGEGVLQVFVNGERLDDWLDYIPQDGDRIGIEFGVRRETY